LVGRLKKNLNLKNIFKITSKIYWGVGIWTSHGSMWGGGLICVNTLPRKQKNIVFEGVVNDDVQFLHLSSEPNIISGEIFTCRFLNKFCYDTQFSKHTPECDFNTHECHFYIHEREKYAQTVTITHIK
jgi:hypothetical protein